MHRYGFLPRCECRTGWRAPSPAARQTCGFVNILSVARRESVNGRVFFPVAALSAAFCLTMAVMAAPALGQTYITGTMGYVSNSSDAPAAVANDVSGTGIGLEMGFKPAGGGIGYSLGYTQTPYGNSDLARFYGRLDWVPGDGTLWFDTSYGMGSSDAGDSNEVSVGVYNEFRDSLAGSKFRPYGAIGIAFTSLEFDPFPVTSPAAPAGIEESTAICDPESTISPRLELGLRREISSGSDLKMGLRYGSTGVELTCMLKHVDSDGNELSGATTRSYTVDNASFTLFIDYQIEY